MIMARIDPDTFYDFADLQSNQGLAEFLTSEALDAGRQSAALKFIDLPEGGFAYRGLWLLEWIEWQAEQKAYDRKSEARARFEEEAKKMLIEEQGHVL